ncbi:MAG: hypothetical protein JW862_11955 [Anaerolineales bacterium]|nr:hypothetical protein [Anaerolineales bacterium]
MSTSAANYLAIKNLQADNALLKLLPAEIALRYHAIPIAWDGERITVAMEHPEDEAARQAVLAAIGPSACLVKAETNLLGPILARLQATGAAQPQLKFLEWTYSFDDSCGGRAYAQNLADLLGAQLDTLTTKTTRAPALTLLYQTTAQHDHNLLISGNQPSYQNNKQLIQRLPTNLLLARKVRWPIQSILLVLIDPTLNLATLEWCLLLAKASPARITLLPVLPPVPGMLTPDLQHSLPALLSSNCILGRQLREFSRLLVQAGVNASIRLRPEMPAQQIFQELESTEYDLVASALGPHQKAIPASLQILLRHTDQPLLLARKSPTKAACLFP